MKAYELISALTDFEPDDEVKIVGSNEEGVADIVSVVSSEADNGDAIASILINETVIED